MPQPNSDHVVSPPAAPQNAYDACSDAELSGWRKASSVVTDWPGERGSGQVDIHTGRLTGNDDWVVTHRTEQTEGGWRQT